MLAFGCCIGILLSCTRAEIVYIRDPKGLVQIYLEYSGDTLPDIEYYFYNAGDSEAEPLRFESTDDEGNFEGELPVGVYRVIATNTGASHVEFTGSENYTDFIVKAANPDDAGVRAAEDYTMLLQPDSVYSIVVGELSVTDNDTIRKDTVPVLLTKQLNLEFVMEDGLGTETVSMTGLLPGVYPGVYLYTRAGWQIEDSPERAVNFETVAEGSDKRKAKILLFGVLDPEYGATYTNVMELYLTMTDERVVTAKVDLTTILSDAIANHNGVIPWDIPVSIHVEKTSIGVGAEVEGWVEEGEDIKED
jgi:hypothetical protein